MRIVVREGEEQAPAGAGPHGRRLRHLWDGWRGRLPGAAVGRPAPGLWWQRERDARRPFLWLPAGFAVGILLYFAAEVEPVWWAGWSLAFTAGAGAVWLGRAQAGAAVAALAVASVALGFALAQARTALTSAPVLGDVAVGVMTGWVEAVDVRIAGGRLLVRVTSLADLADTARPYRVRITTPTRPSVRAGDFVTAQVRLLPPPDASRPGGYNFARDAFFQAVGGVGSASGPLRLAPAPADGPPVGLAWSAAVDRARNALTERIVAVIGGAPGAVAASLVTGKRGLIPDETNDDLRAAGIYHVVSISGLHMVLAAGMVFWLVRAVGALVPRLALALDLRKGAALAAMAAGCGYNLFAGAEIATQRSLVMTLALFGAMLADRAALSMRNLSLTALVVLALEPESLLGPSFQMSFAAVAALIALYERPGVPVGQPEASLLGLPGQKRPPTGAPTGPVRKALRWAVMALVGGIVTTLVAEAATAPYGLYHFQRLTPYGVIGNALTLPLVSLVVMPMALVGAVLWPLGLDAPAWSLMGLGVQGMLALSARVADLSGSTMAFHAIGAPALLTLSLATLWIVFWISPIRWAGIPLAAIGVALAAREGRPDLIVGRDGRTAAVRQADGNLMLVGKGPGSFVVEQWLRADGDLRNPKDGSLGQGNRCDPWGCTGILADGRSIAVVLQTDAFDEDCRRAAVIVSPLRAPAGCGSMLVADRPKLDAFGAMTVSFIGLQAIVTGDRNARQDRPWQRRTVRPR